MDTSVRSLNEIPFRFVEDQVNVRLAGQSPTKDYDSAKDLEEATTFDGDKFEWHEHEKSALFLRANNQHLSFPPAFTETQKKVLEQFSSITPFFFLNTFKLIRSQMYSIATDLFSAKAIYVMKAGQFDSEWMTKKFYLLLSNLFIGIECYLHSYQKSNQAIDLGIINTVLPDLVNMVKSAKESSQSNLLQRNCVELEKLLNFLVDCFQEKQTFFPYLLVPCRAYPADLLDPDRIKKLYLDMGNSYSNGIRFFTYRLDEVLTKLFGDSKNKSDKPIKKAKVRKLHKNDQEIKKIHEFINKAKKILLEWQVSTTGVINQKQAELWSDFIASRGIVQLTDRSKIDQVNEQQLLKSMSDFKKKFKELDSGYKKYLNLFDHEKKLIKPILIKMEKALGVDQDQNLFLTVYFDSMIRQNFNVFYKNVSSSLDLAEHWDRSREKWREKLSPFITASLTKIYPSYLVKPLDCMLYEILHVFMEIEKLIPSKNKEQSGLLNEALQHFFLIFHNIKSLITESDEEVITWIDDPFLCAQNLNSLKSKIKSANEGATELSESLILNKIQYIQSFLQVINSLFVKFSDKENQDKLLPVFMEMGRARDNQLSDQEMENRFIQECFDASLWVLKRYDSFEAIIAFEDTIHKLEEFNELMQDSSYTETIAELADFTFFNSVKTDQFYKDLKTFLYRVQNDINNALAFLEEPNGRDMKLWMQLIGYLNTSLEMLPDYQVPQVIYLNVCRIEKETKEKIKSFSDRSEKHRLVSASFMNLYTAIDKFYDILDNQVMIPEVIIPVLNSSLIKVFKTKQTLLELEGIHRHRKRPRTTASKAILSHSKAVTGESESETQEIMPEFESVAPTENLKPNPIKPCLFPVIMLRSILRGLFLEINSQISQPGREQVINALHYTAHIAELLEKHADHDDWNDTTLLVFLSKSALLLEQTLKYELMQISGSWSNEDKKGLYSHDLSELWQKYQTCMPDSSLIIKMPDRNLLGEFSTMASKTSRYPLDSGSSQVLKPLVDSMAVCSEQLMKGNQVKSKLNVEEAQKYRQEGMALIEISLKIWKRQNGSKAGYSLEYPIVTDINTHKSNKDYKPLLHQQWQLILEECRKIKGQPHNFNTAECGQHFKESCAHMEGALFALGQLLSQVDAQAIPYSVADAVLLHASTLLEQAALALIAQLGITNPQPIDKRPWKYTHNISDFLLKIGQADGTFKLTDQQLQHVLEVTEFLTTTTHYPSAGVGSLSLAFNNLRKLCELRRKLVLNQRFLNPNENNWCRDKFGMNADTWLEKINNQIEVALNNDIYSRALQTLEIVLKIVR